MVGQETILEGSLPAPFGGNEVEGSSIEVDKESILPETSDQPDGLVQGATAKLNQLGTSLNPSYRPVK